MGRGNTHPLVQELYERFGRAVDIAGGVAVRRFRIGGRGVELRFAGDRLLELLTPPLDHLAADDVPDHPFTVRVWDSASTGIEPPAPWWTVQDYGPRGDIRYDLGSPIRASYSIDAGMLTLFDAATGEGMCWVRDPDKLPAWDLAAPLRTLFAWWASATDGQLAHGAAVGERGVAVLLTAAGGSGKSTTALRCLDAGLSYLGDDYVMLRFGTPPMVCSLYNTAKLTPHHLRRALPHFDALVVRDSSSLQDKVTLRLHDSHASQLVPMLPLGAILITGIAPDGRTTVVPTSGSEVLKAVVPSTIFQLPGAGAPEFARLAEIVRRVSCFQLLVGADSTANVRAIRRVIRECAPQG